ncbi:MAG: choice-of-anchor D domain-containing protein [Candidatus Marinimicrobia bacterium]|nr:choice-of-anchor D domain-containing protein [Candidatus Neomarinimicrobiota bacterium]
MWRKLTVILVVSCLTFGFALDNQTQVISEDNTEVGLLKAKLESGADLTAQDKIAIEELGLLETTVAAGPYTFSVSRTTYLTEDFETWPPTSWTLDPATGTGAWLQDSGDDYGPGSAQEGTYCAFFNDFDYSSGTTGTMTSPAIDLSSATAPRLAFYYYDSGGSDVVIVKGSTDGTTFTDLHTTPSTVTPWTQTVVDLSAYVGNSTVYIQFYGSSVWGTSNPHIDNFSVEEAPTDPIISVSSDSLGFGMVPPGMAVDLILTITNVGGDTLNITDIASDEAAFTVDVTTGVVEVDSSLDVTVTFTSSTPVRTDFAGTLTITSDAASSPDEVLLGGDAAPTSGGPDTFGYEWANSYDAAGPTYAWIDTTGALNRVIQGDDMRGEVTLPFDFYYYGAWYNNFWLTSNGWAGFGDDPGTSSYINYTIPSTSGVENMVAAFWDDLKTGPSYHGDIYTKVVGTEPNRQFVVIWQDVYRSYSAIDDWVTFEIILEEGTNNITLQYYDVSFGNATYDGGLSATVGIENADGDDGSLYQYLGDPQLVYDGLAIEFVAPPPPVLPVVDLSDDVIDFGGIHLGHPADFVLSVSNVGGADLNVSDVTSSNAVFTVDVTSGVVAVGADLDVTITFDPTAEVADTANLIITSDAASSPDTVVCYGLGLPAIPADYFMTGFEPDGSLPEGWTSENQNAASFRHHSGAYSRYFSAWGSPPQYMMSQRLDLSTGTHNVYFWWNETGLLNDDSCVVEMSVDGGLWTEVGVVGGGDNEAWTFETLSLGTPESDDVFVRWTYHQGTGTNNSYYLDDIAVPPVYVPPMSLFFSEFIEGGSYNKAFEIYNGMGADVDLANYLVLGNYNGNPFNDTLRFPVGTILADGDVYVVANDLADAAIIAVADSIIENPYTTGTSYIASFNGDDVRGLFHIVGTDTTLIDLFGLHDLVDPGSGWDVAGVPAATKDHTLVRKADVIIGNIDWMASAGTNADDSEWIVMPKDHLRALGSHPDIDFYESNDNLTDAFPVVSGVLYENMAIDPVDDVDYFTFEADFREIISIDMYVLDYSLLDGAIAILDSNGVELEYADVGSPYSGGDEYLYDFDAPYTGTYYILLGYWADVRASTGAYALELTIDPAPPAGAVEGTVTDLATTLPMIGVSVEVTTIDGDFIALDSTDADGYYLVEYLPEGFNEIGFYATGFHAAGFGISIVADDTIEQNITLVPDTMTQSLIYYTGFETTDDSGSVGALAGDNYFAVVDTFFAPIDTVLPADGDQMLAFPEQDSLTYQSNDAAYWMAGSAIGLASRDEGSLLLQVDAFIDVENNWDFFYLAVLLDNGYFYIDEDAAMTGYSDGWVTVTADFSWVLNSGSAYFVPMIYFEADGSVVSGWGGAFDNLMAIYDDFYNAPVADLEVTHYEADATLTWAAPATRGTVSYDLQRVNFENPFEVDDNEGVAVATKGPRPKEKVTMTYEYSNPSRDLVGYKVYRQDAPFALDGPAFLDVTTDLTYTDATVVDGNYYDFAVTTVYDEGESKETIVSTKIGAITQVDPFAEDFEGLSGALPTGWEAFTTQSDGISWTVGDSAAADSAFGIGVSYPVPGHTDFAFIEDGRGDGEPFEALLISPFIDASNMYSAVVSFSGYEQGYADFGNTWTQLMVRVDMSEWHIITDFSYDHNAGWVDYMGDLAEKVAGEEYVQFAFYYWHQGLNSGGGNGIAVDDFDLFGIAGPTNLTATGAQGQIELSWSEPTSRTAAAFDEMQLKLVTDEEMENRSIDGLAPELVTNRDVCYSNWLPSTWLTAFTGPDSGWSAPTFVSLYEFPVGPMTLEKAIAHGYYNTGDGLAMRALISVCIADTLGDSFDTLAIDTLDFVVDPTYANHWDAELDLVGLTYEATDSTYLKVTWEPLDYGVITLWGDVQLWVPAIRMDDPNDDYWSGLCGYDSSGVFEPAERDWFIEICGTPTPPALRFNVYRDDLLLNAEPLEELTYMDEDVIVLEEHEYFVTGFVPIIPASDNAGLMLFVDTDSSNHAAAAALNTPPSAPSLAVPPDNFTVAVNNLTGAASFAWAPSVETDIGQSVTYDFELILGTYTWAINTEITTVSIPYAELYTEIFDNQGVQSLTGTWNVLATDGLDDTPAANGPRNITVDVTAVGVDEGPAIPDVFALHQNYPNPFNPNTTIAYDVPEVSHVRIDIYNLLGQKIRTLINGEHAPAYYHARWDGTTDAGAIVASGMYIYRIDAGKFSAIHKLVIMK